jgi:hypothetical protein
MVKVDASLDEEETESLAKREFEREGSERA